MILALMLTGALMQGAALPEPVRIVREIQVAIDRDGGQSLERAWQLTLASRPRQPQAMLAVASYARARYRYERADSLYRLLDARGTEVGLVWRAMAQVGMAQWRALGSESARADSLFGEARATAQRADSPLVEAEAVLGLAQLRQRSHGVKAGRALLDAWWALLERPSAQDSAQRLCVIGAIDEQLGDTTGRHRIEAGAENAERLRLWRVAGNCRLSLAQSAERRGYFVGAGIQARMALAHFARIRYDVGTALASQWYGYVLVQTNVFANARVLLEQAIIAARVTRFESVEAWAHSGLAELHLALGDVGQARQHASLAAISHAARNDRWGVANSRRFEADALQASGDLPSAIGRYAEAYDAYVAAGLPLNALPALSARASAQMRLGQLDSAERTMATAASLGRTNEGARNEQTVLRAGVAMRRGQLGVADSLLRTTTTSREWRRADLRLAAITVAAREAQVALRRDRAAMADSALGAITNALDQWRRYPMNKGITASMAQLRNNWGGLADVYPDLVAQLAGRGRNAVAFDFIEHIRARDIVERSLRAAAQLRDTSAAARALRPERDAAPIVTLTELQRVLAADEAYVSFMLGLDESATTAIVVTRDSVVSRALPGRRALLPDIQVFAQLAVAGTEAIAPSKRLGTALLAPIFSAVPASVTRFTVSPDGELNRIPFDALRLPDGRFAVERATISTAPSATAWLALRTIASASGDRLIAFGNPRYPVSRPTRNARNVSLRAPAAVPFDGITLARLPFSGDEARRVARYGVHSTLLLAGEASEDALQGMDWRRVAVLHVAAHALVDPESQTGTALALTPSGTSDGFMSPGEVAQLDLHGPLVVLSACRSSGGQVLGGEGLRGLTAPFLEAGARAVVATHWSIGDRSVVPFIDRFYAAMATGLRVDDALRQAKLAAIRDGVSIADWGSYSIIGDGSMRVPLSQPLLSPIAWLRSARPSLRDATAR
ncbi:MAG: CHAT domain-containing protein [Gemmatimonadaceae bacterium]|nr:CHAT domain-containing protein [Gemmatimonadaceae bacterium]